ncbi:MAG TPA: Xaa-Pro peptidase family protein [Rhizomicrobium sp.]|nr:Xaa-Pro peptidase family protein [Rhizomicrobium sp.]
MNSPSASPPRIAKAERKARLNALCAQMEKDGIAATLIGPTSSLRYFTGVNWHPSERFTGALVHANGKLDYICPAFERDKVSAMIAADGEFSTWQEEQSPYALIADRLGANGKMAVDDQVALFTYRGLARVIATERLADGGPLINRLRRSKSVAEIALMQYAKDITLEVQRRAHKHLRAGIRASEVEQFIDSEHRALGADQGNTFCIVSFGEDTSLPHGGETDRVLKENDAVLIDTGTQYDGYNSDITRSYVFGEPSADYVRVWNAEKESQAAAYDAAKTGSPCEGVDAAARASQKANGFGPDYHLPGLPHRTGHGIGLDIHEAPNLVRGDKTALAQGMCFSNEPMIVVPGKFGIRLEDHFYMEASGPRWFTEPSHSAGAPFQGVAPLD